TWPCRPAPRGQRGDGTASATLKRTLRTVFEVTILADLVGSGDHRLQRAAFRRCFADVDAPDLAVRAPPAGGTRRRRGVRLAIAAGALIVAAALALVAARAALPSWIVRQAAARGVVLEPGSVEVHFDRIVVRDATIRLAGVRGFEAHVA